MLHHMIHQWMQGKGHGHTHVNVSVSDHGSVYPCTRTQGKQWRQGAHTCQIGSPQLLRHRMCSVDQLLPLTGELTSAAPSEVIHVPAGQAADSLTQAGHDADSPRLEKPLTHSRSLEKLLTHPHRLDKLLTAHSRRLESHCLMLDKFADPFMQTGQAADSRR